MAMVTHLSLWVPETLPSAPELGSLLPDEVTWNPGGSTPAPARSALVTFRLLYLIFVRLCSWLVLLPRSDGVKNPELRVVPPQIPALQRQASPPRLTWAARAALPALTRPLANARRCQLAL